MPARKPDSSPDNKGAPAGAPYNEGGLKERSLHYCIRGCYCLIGEIVVLRDWTVEARDFYCHWIAREASYSMMEVGQELGICQPTVSIAVRRGRQVTEERQYRLSE